MMIEPFFISKSLALKIHQQHIEYFGGGRGIRDDAMLESALGSARQTWHYTQDVFQVAAQYCKAVANNHPFVDGNKRTATACMLVFLAANQHKPQMSNTELYAWVIQLILHEHSHRQLAQLLAQHCQHTQSI